MGERRWTNTDRELVANAYHWAARNSCGPDSCPGVAECVYAEHLDWEAFGDGLDALTAAGWRPPPPEVDQGGHSAPHREPQSDEHPPTHPQVPL